MPYRPIFILPHLSYGKIIADKRSVKLTGGLRDMSETGPVLDMALVVMSVSEPLHNAGPDQILGLRVTLFQRFQ